MISPDSEEEEKEDNVLYIIIRPIDFSSRK